MGFSGYRLPAVVLLAWPLLFFGADVSSQEAVEKTRVVLTKPEVGPGVATSVRQHLDLTVLSAELEKSLLGTRKFEVLTRGEAQISASLEEQELAKSSMSAGNAAAAGQMEAADYVAVPTVRSFKFFRGHSPVPNVSEKWFRQDSGSLEVDVQIIDTVTGQVKSALTMTDRFATGRDVVNSRGGSPGSARFTAMAANIAGEFAEKLVDAVFPMMIIGVQGPSVYLNRGEDGGLREGDVLSVFRPGVPLIDPYNGEILGRVENEIGAVRVERVNPRFTIASILQEQTTEPPVEGDIVRRP